MKRPALAKGSPKKPLKKGILKRHNLKKLGEMNLKEKVQKATEEHENERDAAAELQKQLTPAEKSRAWGRHQTHLCQKGHEEEKKTFEKGNKKEKGYLTALFLMRQEAPKFCNTSESVQAESKLTYREKWMSEKEALEKFGDDLDHHLGSGRVSWRECSRTWGVYEYLDNEDCEKTTTGKKTRKWTLAQEYEMAEDEGQSWEDHLQKELNSLLMEHTPGKGKGSSLVKGHGKGAGKGAKGKSKNKGKSRDTPALEDMPPEEQLGEALKKLKKTKELLTQTHSNYEEALEKVKGLKYLTKPALKDKEKQLEQLETTLGKVKKLLAKGDKNKLDGVKEDLKEAVATMQEAKDEAKELVQISLKTQSKASKQ